MLPESSTPPGARVVAPIDVETFGLRLENGALRARVVRSPLSGDPDGCAATAIGLRPGDSSSAVLHSTSWRWTDGRVVLTYLCCPDPQPFIAGSVVIPAHGHPAGVDPARPGSSDPSQQQVLHHGIDHLAWLADHHLQLVEHSRSAHPLLWDRVMHAGRHRAGQFPRAI